MFFNWFYLFKKFQCNSNKLVFRPVSKIEFGSHVARLCLNQQKGFSNEFDDICALLVDGDTATAHKPFNRTKNRHSNFVPCTP